MVFADDHLTVKIKPTKIAQLYGNNGHECTRLCKLNLQNGKRSTIRKNLIPQKFSAISLYMVCQRCVQACDVKSNAWH